MLRSYQNPRVLGLRVFSVMADGIHQRFVRHYEKDRRIFRGVFMTVKIPQRYDERIALLPLITLVANIANAATAPNIINRRACVTMALGLLSATEHVDL